ncbi:MAG: YbhB/YbcL family Raf kinase inhibitor-like protein [Candidatus Acidiferrum sp.]
MHHNQRKFVFAALITLGCFAIITACSRRPPETAPLTLQLISPDFSPGATIPKPLTCDGGDLSPALQWQFPPDATQSFALIADDPDAPIGTWVHWVIFDMPPTLRSLPQNFPKAEQSADGSRQGANDFGKIGYGGPCPPGGQLHRYYFKLYALDAKLNLKLGAAKKDLERAMQGHILARGEYIGRYSH